MCFVSFIMKVQQGFIINILKSTRILKEYFD